MLQNFRFCNFSAGSFSAVSKRNFARKYAFVSVFQALQDLHTSAPLQSQFFSKNRFEKSAIFVKNSNILQNPAKLQKLARFQKVQQVDNLVDFEKCSKTRIYLQRSAPVQPKTSEILPKFCRKLATTLRVRYLAVRQFSHRPDSEVQRLSGDPEASVDDVQALILAVRLHVILIFLHVLHVNSFTCKRTFTHSEFTCKFAFM